MPFTVGVRDRCMYSHSLRFGNEEPFRTGCTAVVDVKLTGPELNSDGVLCDILAAQRALRSVLEGFEHVDLDTLPVFAGKNMTVEVVAQAICVEFITQLKTVGAPAPITAISVSVAESDIASAAFLLEAPPGGSLLGPDAP